MYSRWHTHEILPRAAAPAVKEQVFDESRPFFEQLKPEQKGQVKVLARQMVRMNFPIDDQVEADYVRQYGKSNESLHYKFLCLITWNEFQKDVLPFVKDAPKFDEEQQPQYDPWLLAKPNGYSIDVPYRFGGVHLRSITSQGIVPKDAPPWYGREPLVFKGVEVANSGAAFMACCGQEATTSTPVGCWIRLDPKQPKYEVIPYRLWFQLDSSDMMEVQIGTAFMEPQCFLDLHKSIKKRLEKFSDLVAQYPDIPFRSEVRQALFSVFAKVNLYNDPQSFLVSPIPYNESIVYDHLVPLTEEQKAERKRKREEEARKRQEEDERKRREEEERRRLSEAERKRRQEEEARKRREEEERKRRDQEERSRREEEERRRLSEAERQRRQEEERKRREQDADRQREEEARRKRDEEDKRRRDEEATEKKEEEAARTREAEQQRADKLSKLLKTERVATVAEVEAVMPFVVDRPNALSIVGLLVDTILPMRTRVLAAEGAVRSDYKRKIWQEFEEDKTIIEMQKQLNLVLSEQQDDVSRTFAFESDKWDRYVRVLTELSTRKFDMTGKYKKGDLYKKIKGICEADQFIRDMESLADLLEETFLIAELAKGSLLEQYAEVQFRRTFTQLEALLKGVSDQLQKVAFLPEDGIASADEFALLHESIPTGFFDTLLGSTDAIEKEWYMLYDSLQEACEEVAKKLNQETDPLVKQFMFALAECGNADELVATSLIAYQKAVNAAIREFRNVAVLFKGSVPVEKALTDQVKAQYDTVRNAILVPSGNYQKADFYQPVLFRLDKSEDLEVAGAYFDRANQAIAVVSAGTPLHDKLVGIQGRATDYLLSAIEAFLKSDDIVLAAFTVAKNFAEGNESGFLPQTSRIFNLMADDNRYKTEVGRDLLKLNGRQQIFVTQDESFEGPEQYYVPTTGRVEEDVFSLVKKALIEWYKAIWGKEIEQEWFTLAANVIPPQVPSNLVAVTLKNEPALGADFKMTLFTWNGIGSGSCSYDAFFVALFKVRFSWLETVINTTQAIHVTKMRNRGDAPAFHDSLWKDIRYIQGDEGKTRVCSVPILWARVIGSEAADTVPVGGNDPRVLLRELAAAYGVSDKIKTLPFNRLKNVDDKIQLLQVTVPDEEYESGVAMPWEAPAKLLDSFELRSASLYIPDQKHWIAAVQYEGKWYVFDSLEPQLAREMSVDEARIVTEVGMGTLEGKTFMPRSWFYMRQTPVPTAPPDDEDNKSPYFPLFEQYPLDKITGSFRDFCVSKKVANSDFAASLDALSTVDDLSLLDEYERSGIAFALVNILGRNGRTLADRRANVSIGLAMAELPF